nr:reverse transcriptase domain-containing protein [Tanacetum cinerariifolium]
MTFVGAEDLISGCCWDSSFLYAQSSYHLKELRCSPQCLTLLRIFKRCCIFHILWIGYMVCRDLPLHRFFFTRTTQIKLRRGMLLLSGSFHRVVSICGLQYLPTEVIRGNIVTNLRVTPSWREIVSLIILVKLASYTPPEGGFTTDNIPPHLEYAFLEADDKLPIIIAKDLSVEEKTALIIVLKSHKRAIAWKLSDIKDQILDRLAGNEYYCFLDGFSSYFQIPIDPKDQEKTTFTCPYGMFAYRCMPFRLCNAPGTFQRCVMAIFHDMIEKTMEVFMDDFLVFGNSFQTCLSHLEKMLKRCEDTNLCLNYEKSHFMVKEGIVLGHKISKNGIEVDKDKVEVIAKLPHPTTVKGIRGFLGHVGFYRRFIKDFSKIARPMTRLLEKDTPCFFSKECVEAFQTLKRKLTEASILIAPD